MGLPRKIEQRNYDKFAEGPDGYSVVKSLTPTTSIKMTISGSVTYIAKAAVGSAQSAAVWQCLKLDETSGMVITWADGDAAYDNLATDLTSLSYS